MMFLAIKNQRVPARCTRIADTSKHLRENRHLSIVAAANFFTNDTGIGKKGSRP